MKILLVNNSRMGGVEYYRMMMPNHILSLMYKEFQFNSVERIDADEFTLTEVKTYNPTTKETELKKYNEPVKVSMDEFLKQFDLIHFCRVIDNYNDTKVTERLKRLGIPFGLDLDDYWQLPEHHILYEDYRQNNTGRAVIQAIKDAHFVTCTTSLIAKEISKFNKNVHVIENGIDENQIAWQPDTIRSSRTRFGFFQGSTHLEDIRGMAQSVRELFKRDTFKDRFQIVVAGFDIKPDHPSPYIGYEWALTDGLKLLKEDYQLYLRTCTSNNNLDWKNEPYWRIWGTDVDNWGMIYNFADVSVIPLLNNRFNRSKSELKLIEAGFKGKAAIVQNVNPYRILATEKNSWLCNTPTDFYNAMRDCIRNPSKVEDKASQLREDVLSKHKLSDLTEKRKQIYLKYKL